MPHKFDAGRRRYIPKMQFRVRTSVVELPGTLNGMIREDAPVLLVFNRLRFYVLRKWVGNFKRNLYGHESLPQSFTARGLTRQPE